MLKLVHFEDSEDYYDCVRTLMQTIRNVGHHMCFSHVPLTVMLCTTQDCNLCLYLSYKQHKAGFTVTVYSMFAKDCESISFIDEVKIFESVFFTPPTYLLLKRVVETYVGMYFLRMPITELK